jgi:hypothetical protein
MGTEWPTNQRPSDDIHPMPFLQVHGRCRPLSFTSSCDPVATKRILADDHGKVMVLLLSQSIIRIVLPFFVSKVSDFGLAFVISSPKN